MPDDGGAKPEGKKNILMNPWVITIGAGVVLFVMLQSGNKSGAVNTSGADASATQQALSDQQKAINDQLAAQQKSVTDALAQQASDNLAQQQQAAQQLAAALKLNQPAPQAAGGTADQSALDKLQAEIDALKSANPFAGAGTVSTNPNTPGATQALQWSQSVGVPYEWGLGFIQHFGRVPNSIAELNVWRSIIGNQQSDGKWCIGGACI